MNIHVHCIAYNEEKIIPYFIRHYSRFCSKIFIWDNHSTDHTATIAKSYPGVVVKEWGGKEINEFEYLKIKQNCRLHSFNADYVIVVDCDEFLDIESIPMLEIIKSEGVTLPSVVGMEMLSKDFDFKSDISLIKRFVYKENLCKRCIFDPKLEMVWDVGCHPSETGKKMLRDVNGVVENTAFKLNLKHYKWVNLEYVVNRYKSYASRLSQINKQYRLGFHYTKSKEDIEKEFYEQWNNSTEIL
jgi:hypothetical protein